MPDMRSEQSENRHILRTFEIAMNGGFYQDTYSAPRKQIAFQEDNLQSIESLGISYHGESITLPIGGSVIYIENSQENVASAEISSHIKFNANIDIASAEYIDVFASYIGEYLEGTLPASFNRDLSAALPFCYYFPRQGMRFMSGGEQKLICGVDGRVVADAPRAVNPWNGEWNGDVRGYQDEKTRSHGFEHIVKRIRNHEDEELALIAGVKFSAERFGDLDNAVIAAEDLKEWDDETGRGIINPYLRTEFLNTR